MRFYTVLNPIHSLFRKEFAQFLRTYPKDDPDRIFIEKKHRQHNPFIIHNILGRMMPLIFIWLWISAIILTTVLLFLPDLNWLYLLFIFGSIAIYNIYYFEKYFVDHEKNKYSSIEHAERE